MARGFDSKQVEEQQSMAEADKQRSQREQLSPQQQTAKREHANLELVRTRLQNDLAAATNDRHRAMIEAALKDVEKKLMKS
jgi:hypothetical protein